MIVGRTSKNQGERLFTFGAMREYFLYVKLRTCLLVGVWPPLMQCLGSEHRTRSLWIRRLRSGKILDEASALSKAEMHGFRGWAAKSIADSAALFMRTMAGSTVEADTDLAARHIAAAAHSGAHAAVYDD